MYKQGFHLLGLTLFAAVTVIVAVPRIVTAIPSLTAHDHIAATIACPNGAAIANPNGTNHEHRTVRAEPCLFGATGNTASGNIYDAFEVWDNRNLRIDDAGAFDDGHGFIEGGSAPRYCIEPGVPANAAARIIDAFNTWDQIAADGGLRLGLDFQAVAPCTNAFIEIRVRWGSTESLGEIMPTEAQQPDCSDDAAGAQPCLVQMRFSSTVTWDFNVNRAGVASTDYHFYSTALHEVGHVVGLDEQDDADDVMIFDREAGCPQNAGDPGVGPCFDALDADSTNGARDLYSIPVTTPAGGTGTADAPTAAGVSFRTCDDGSSQSIPAFACTLNINDSTTLDAVTGFDIAPADANFDAVVTYTEATRFSLANDAALPDGAIVGELHSLETLGLVNGGCFTQLLVDYTLIDATTDFVTASAMDPAKIITPAGPADNRLLNLAQDDGDWDNNGSVEHAASANNGIPDGADGYPSYVATALDPDGAGPTLPLVPRARYMGVAVVANTVVILQFTVIEPGALRALVGGGGAATSLGYASLTFLQDPTEAPTNGAITDVCTPLSTTTALDGTTRDNECTPAPGPAECTFTVAAGGQTSTVRIDVENGTRQGDVTPCDTVPNECGSTRFASLAVPGGGATATYLVQNQSLRRTDDGDGHENNLDPCPLHNDIAWDPRSALNPLPGDADGDGLPDSCDPNDAQLNQDEDGDGWLNRGDNCPLVKNGDTSTTGPETAGQTAIGVADTAGFPAPPFTVDIDSAAIRERRTVSSVVAGAPGVFNISVGLTNNHLAGVNVAQIFESNRNAGQGDLDIPFPAAVPEGPRNDNIGPECDVGTVGTDTLTPTAAQGHYHRSASIARLCILSAPGALEDDDGDGVCDADDPNDANGDSDGDSIAVGEPERIYTDVDANGVVSTGDGRKTMTATGLGTGLPAGGVVSCPADFDCGQPLKGFEANERHSDDEGGAGTYNVNECVYSSADAIVSSGDTRLHVDVADVPSVPGPPDTIPDCNFLGGSTVVCPGNSDCGVALVGFTAVEKHIDSRVVSVGLTALDYRNIFQTCTNRFSEDSDTDIDFADSDCLGAHFDRFDNCINLTNTAPPGLAQVDLDWDGVGDACDPLVDADNSPSSDSLERHIGTGIETVCSRSADANDEAIDAMAEDLNDDRQVTAADLNAMAQQAGKNVPPAAVRFDIAPEPGGDNQITGGDLNKVAQRIGFACSSQVPPL